VDHEIKIEMSRRAWSSHDLALHGWFVRHGGHIGLNANWVNFLSTSYCHLKVTRKQVHIALTLRLTNLVISIHHHG
jgi:hypothetical protein